MCCKKHAEKIRLNEPSHDHNIDTHMDDYNSQHGQK